MQLQDKPKSHEPSCEISIRQKLKGLLCVMVMNLGQYNEQKLHKYDSYVVNLALQVHDSFYDAFVLKNHQVTRTKFPKYLRLTFLIRLSYKIRERFSEHNQEWQPYPKYIPLFRKIVMPMASLTPVPSINTSAVSNVAPLIPYYCIYCVQQVVADIRYTTDMNMFRFFPQICKGTGRPHCLFIHSKKGIGHM